MNSSRNPLTYLSIFTLDGKNGRKKKRKGDWGFFCALMTNWMNFGFIWNFICPLLHKTPFTSIIYISSQMKIHLIHLRSNAIKSIMKVNVLFQIHALVSRVTVFDEIRKNPYLRESSYFPLFESKTNSISSISFNIISLSSN